MRLYILDVGVYARAPLFSHLAQLVKDGRCLVPRAVTQIFMHRLQTSVQYFLNKFDYVKQLVVERFLPRYSRKLRGHRILKFVEKVRQGSEDSFLYATLRVVLAPELRQYIGAYLSELLPMFEGECHIVKLLHALYMWLRAQLRAMHSFTSSVKNALDHYLETRLGCYVDIGDDYSILAPQATHLAEVLEVKDREDLVVALSLRSLPKEILEGANTLTLVTMDSRMEEKVLAKLRSHDNFFANVTVHLVPNPDP